MNETPKKADGNNQMLYGFLIGGGVMLLGALLLWSIFSGPTPTYSSQGSTASGRLTTTTAARYTRQECSEVGLILYPCDSDYFVAALHQVNVKTAANDRALREAVRKAGNEQDAAFAAANARQAAREAALQRQREIDEQRRKDEAVAEANRYIYEKNRERISMWTRPSCDWSMYDCTRR